MRQTRSSSKPRTHARNEPKHEAVIRREWFENPEFDRIDARPRDFGSFLIPVERGRAFEKEAWRQIVANLDPGDRHVTRVFD